MQQETISLTDQLNINQGGHILYFYSSPEQYIENAISYILGAKQFNQQVIFIESRERYEKVLEKLETHLTKEEINVLVHYIDHYDFYQMYGDFHFERVLENFKNTIQPFINHKLSVRVWGHVDWKSQDNIMDKLHTYECECDLTVSEIGYMTVCCYDGLKVPAYIQIEMMKTHEYFMTDTELVRSSLYKKAENVVFPSISFQTEIESEIDLFKQKLDFIHVVSHEVRNPLTVIKSYASMLKDEITDENNRKKLQLIEDYSIAIDHEIHHIIQTEQMLTTDTLWKKKLIVALPALEEVIEIMKIKARTQNITLTSDLQVDDSVIIYANLMGFKLIISNLLSNAIKYSYEKQYVHIKGYIKEKLFVIEVKDEGIGMSEEQIKEMYQKYKKMNQEKTGQGIGLFMVKKLVDNFNGKIEVESEIGSGTTFKIYFPA